MNKKDIVTGVVIETRDKKQYICINDTLVSNTEFLNLYTYTDDLKSLYSKDSDIIKVFEKKDGKDLAPNNWFKNLKVIWKRSEFTKWDKVQVRNTVTSKWKNAYFIREDIKDKHPYVVSFCDEYTYTDNNDETYWKYCKTN